MKIHSDTLTPTDILSAVPEGCELVAFNHPGFGWTRVGVSGSRSREQAFTVRMSGSSKSTMRSGNLRESHKSATWDEWGIFIANLYDLDPGRAD